MCLQLQLTVKALGLASGKMIPAAKFGQAADESEALELSEEEKEIEDKIRVCLEIICFHIELFSRTVKEHYRKHFVTLR